METRAAFTGSLCACISGRAHPPCFITLRDRSGGNVLGAAPRPSVTSFKTEHGVLLLCEAHGSPEPQLEWQDGSGSRLADGLQRVHERGGRFFSSLNITVKRAGTFRCVASQPGISHRVHAETYVPLSGAAQEPVVKILDETKEWAWLQCVVRAASPDLRVEWEDGSGKRLVAHEPVFPVGGASDDIILNITVTQTDRYRCVSTDRSNKRSEAETYVYIAGSSVWTSTIVAFLGGVSLVVVVVVVVLAVKRCIKQSRTDSSGNQDATKEMNALTGTSEEG